MVSEEEHERTIKKALYFYPKGLFAHRSPLIAKIRKETEEFSSIGPYYNISAFQKIQKEAPFHALTNAGHISYVELDGDICKNIDAFESVIRCMKEAGIGYGSVNHPVDRDPVCGYNGIIGDVCPRCGRHAGEGVPIEKLAELRKKYHDVPDYSHLVH